MKTKLKSTLLIAAVIFGTGMSCILFTGCDTRDSVGDHVGDALDSRKNEDLKDAGEELKDAVKKD